MIQHIKKIESRYQQFVLEDDSVDSHSSRFLRSATLPTQQEKLIFKAPAKQVLELRVEQKDNDYQTK